jgi:hypothetical protein
MRISILAAMLSATIRSVKKRWPKIGLLLESIKEKTNG